MPDTQKLLTNPSEAIALGAIELRNRITLRGATTHHSVDLEVDGGRTINRPSERARAYYEARAKGGASLIVVSSLPVHQSAIRHRASLYPDDSGLTAEMAKITEACHKHGAKVILQLEHMGANADSEFSDMALWSPSGKESAISFHSSHAMSSEEVEMLLKSYASAAKMAMDANFDGVEIDGGAASLIEQFWSEAMNDRTDRWGGSFTARQNFCLDAISRVRKAIGKDKILSVQTSGENSETIGLPVGERLEILTNLDKTNKVNLIHITSGDMMDRSRSVPTFMHPAMPVAEFSKEMMSRRTTTSIMVSGGVVTAGQVHRIFGEEMADLVGCSRAMMVDSEFANKLLQGNLESIRPCAMCTEYCQGRVAKGYWATCVANPTMGREAQWGESEIRLSENPQSIVVVGGGPAGLEFSRQAARRGHRIKLIEKSEQIGGQLNLLKNQPDRTTVDDLITWYNRELSKLQVSIETGRTVTETDADIIEADTVILATGSSARSSGHQRSIPYAGELPMSNTSNVFFVAKLDNDEAFPKGNVLVLDDCHDWASLGTVRKLTSLGAKVTLVVSGPSFGKFIAASGTLGALRKEFSTLGVRVLYRTKIVKWNGNSAELLASSTGEQRNEPFGSLVIANTAVSNKSLLDPLSKAGVNVKLIGDAMAPRSIYAAILQARELANEL